MSYAVIIGTTSAFWIADGRLPANCVLYDGPLAFEVDTGKTAMVWDGGLLGIREKTAQELAQEAGAAKSAQKSATQQQAALTAFCTSCVAQKPDPVADAKAATAVITQPIVSP